MRDLKEEEVRVVHGGGCYEAIIVGCAMIGGGIGAGANIFLNGYNASSAKQGFIIGTAAALGYKVLDFSSAH